MAIYIVTTFLACYTVYYISQLIQNRMKEHEKVRFNVDYRFITNFRYSTVFSTYYSFQPFTSLQLFTLSYLV